MPRARSLQVWGSAHSGVSAWVLTFPGGRFTLLISPELHRGFSGEGQVLDHLAAGWERALPRVQALLRWDAMIDPSQIAESSGLSADEVTGSLAALAALGAVGYDLHQGRYFHRELPFDTSKISRLNPRLKRAEALRKRR